MRVGHIRSLLARAWHLQELGKNGKFEEFICTVNQSPIPCSSEVLLQTMGGFAILRNTL
jgi:hypothetical protein